MSYIGRKAAPGFTFNPLLKLPRNGPCPCGSGLKFKKCHLPDMPHFLPEKTVADLRRKDAPAEELPSDDPAFGVIGPRPHSVV